MPELTAPEKDRIKRFGTSRIAEHWLLIFAFLALALTGLSQKFYYLGMSREFIIHLGGIDKVRSVHRYAGVAFSAIVLWHMASAAAGVFFRGWEPSMLISKKDVTDAVDNMKYYIGVNGLPAQCARYNYKEKFVYWCVLTGGLQMLVTGFTLWFPAAAVGLLPGSFIPAAKALHSNEALLIFLLIAVWHIYDSIFSPDVFPLDTSIFTGRISRQRMLNEHPIELARMEGVGLDALLEEQRRKAAERRPDVIHDG